MKIVCVNNGYLDGALDTSVHLTLGKVYEALGTNPSISDDAFNVVNDKGKICKYYHKRFKSLDYIRGDKLNKILNEK